jgi:hypothetical protein
MADVARRAGSGRRPLVRGVDREVVAAQALDGDHPAVGEDG